MTVLIVCAALLIVGVVLTVGALLMHDLDGSKTLSFIALLCIGAALVLAMMHFDLSAIIR